MIHTILIIEPDKYEAREIVRDLQNLNVRTVVVHSHFQALTLLEDEYYGVILASMDQNGLDGLDFCRILTKRLVEEGRETPHIILMGHEWQRESIVENMAGADDFIIKPWLSSELRWRTKNGLRRLDEFLRLKNMIYFDPDSNALNLAGLEKDLRSEVNRLGRKKGWLSVAVLDFNGREWLEASLSPDFVDHAKKEVLRFLSKSLRNYDRVGRIHQNKICIMSGDCDYDCFSGLLSRVFKAVEGMSIGEFASGPMEFSLCGVFRCVMVDAAFGDSEKCFSHLWQWINSQGVLPDDLSGRAVYLGKEGFLDI